MKGLTEQQRRALLPGSPGEHLPDEVLSELVRDGRGRWVKEGSVWEFEPTDLGLLALRTCPRDQARR